MTNIQNIRGTQDILPEECHHWIWLENKARELFKRYDFLELRTPVIEPTELFERSIGEATDIVSKEMYTFNDRKGRSLTLRPEGTASVVRALIQHKQIQEGIVHRLFYAGPMFRYERPQGGRQRQFHQIGAEIVGSDLPLADVEAMALLHAFFLETGFLKVKFRVNSTGSAASRPLLTEGLRKWLKPSLSKLCPDCRIRFDKNVLRVYDCKVPACQEIIKELPGVKELLTAEDQAYFQQVLKGLKVLGLPFEEDSRLVRGLDYYTHTIFEVDIEGGKTGDVLAGGGRYDGLFASMGAGKAVPAVGFAIGIERVLAHLAQKGHRLLIDGPLCYIVSQSSEFSLNVITLAEHLRRQGMAVTYDLQDRSMRAQFRAAGKSGARFTLILGEDERKRDCIKVKDMQTGQESELPDSEVVRFLDQALHETK